MKIKHLDYFLLFVVALLLILGVSFLATISAPTSLKKFGTTNYYLVHQLTYGVFLGVVLGLVFFLLPLNFLRKTSPILVLVNLIALVLVFLPQIGSRFWGASRWLDLGAIGFQPSEFLKITSILYLSSWLRSKTSQHDKLLIKSKKPHYNFKQVFLPFAIFLAIISIILAFQKDVGTLGVIGLTLLVIYFAAGTPVWQGLLVIIAALSGLFLLVQWEPYRLSRIAVFLHPEIDPMGIGYQMKQALIAIGSGGLAGRGLGMSSQKFGFLPQSMSDSTFAIFAEELGFVGCIVLILLFLMFLWSGIIIARRADDKFQKLCALGITFWIVLQGFVNISSMIGILPLTGIPLPFISYGGSHIVAELIGVGLLLNIARHQKS